MTNLRTDPARFEVVKNALYAAAEEMKIVLAKTAYSPLLKVAGDYSCGIFDINGNMVAQGPDLPIHLGSMPDAVRAIVEAFPDAAPGDVFIHNDPYHGGSHLPDVNVVAPAFHDSRLLGFGCVRAHWPDVGSATPGSYGAVTEIYGEGLRLPPIRLYRGGKPDQSVEAIIFANVRTPEERLGDLRAQVAANWRGAQRLSELAAKYGAEALLRIMQEVLDYSEAMMRAALRELPDGAAEFTDIFDGDGVIGPGETEDETFKVKLRIIKRGDSIIADFAGSDPAVAGPMNAPLTVTASGVFCALKMIADPNSLIPPNSGCWRPVTVTAPPGSVVNAQHPSPVVYANHEMSHRIADMVMGAMFTLTPHRVMAGSQGTSAVITFGGTDYRSGERFVSYESVKGGFGARPVKDGINAVASTVSNMSNTPVEIIEMSFPLLVEEYSLVPDSGGAGRYRGGLGVRRVWRVLERDAHASVCCERTVTPPFGLDGGKPGGAAKIELVPPHGNARRLTSKGGFIAPAGSLVVMEAPGSGGYGNPAARDRDALAADVLDGYVTQGAAERDYGGREN
ncbi:MAG: hydantoinase B/oxoprolinase family protein [Acetobacteraceae bacterium]|nr:hydantoinase B/oxoprolinase family protein [Acetobacteraceae bacterium]